MPQLASEQSGLCCEHRGGRLDGRPPEGEGHGMRYSLTAELPEALTEDRAADAIDQLGEWYDSASITPHKIELDGSVFSYVRLAWIMAELARTQVRHGGTKFTVVLSAD